MTDLSDETSLWAAKGVGSIVGSAISIAYILPKGHREAALRFAVGVVSGLVFGSAVGIKISSELGIHNALSSRETVLIGAAMASLFGWWAVGFILQTKIGTQYDKK